MFVSLVNEVQPSITGGTAAIWMPAIVASIGAVVTLVSMSRASIKEKRAERDAEDSRLEALRLEHERIVAESERRLTEAAMSGYEEHVQSLMADNERLRTTVGTCEGLCAQVQDDNRALREEIHKLRLGVSHRDSIIERLQARIAKLLETRNDEG
jgi:chromosome segregation ATPase